jgi:ABC-2 type transport system permease protein
MLNYRTKAILKREIRAQLFSKAFIFMTILMPVLIFGMYGVMGYVMTADQDNVSYITIASDNDELLEKIKLELTANKSDLLELSYSTVDTNKIESYVDELRESLLDDKITGIIYVPRAAFQSKELRYYSANPKNLTVQSRLKSAINTVFIKEYFKDNQLSDEQIAFVKQNVSLTPIAVSSDKTEEDSGVGKIIVSMVFAFFLYLSVLLIGMAVMRSTTEEKINRVVEVLLSSVTSHELMRGKILGSTITGLTQMLIWTVPIFVVSLVSATMLPEKFAIDITFIQMLYFFVNYIIGLITFVSLFAAVGSIFDNDQDAQQGVMPLMMLIMVPFYIAISLLMNPANSIGEVTSLLPFASIIVMPVRMTLIEVPLWQLVAQLAINLAVMYVCITLAGKIYRIGILMTGKKPKWSEVIGWIKSS